MTDENDGVTVKRFAGMAGVLAIVLAASLQRAQAVAPVPDSVDDVIQMLADLTAIDIDCRDLAVNYGIGFRYAADLGVAPTSVMPTGNRRPAFDKALEATQAGYGPAIVCGTLAHHYSVVLPGSVTFPPEARGGS